MEVDKPEAEQGNYFNFSNLGPFEMFYFFLDFHVNFVITIEPLRNFSHYFVIYNGAQQNLTL